MPAILGPHDTNSIRVLFLAAFLYAAQQMDMRSHYLSILASGLISLFLFYSPPTFAEAARGFSQGPAPEWVKPHRYTPGSERKGAHGGIDYLLVESQRRAGTPDKPRQTFRRFRERILNQAGLDKASELYLYHNQEYQQLALHQVDVIRDGQVINKLDSLVINSFRSEDRASSLIYDGVIRTHLIIDDLRIGDELEYSYTTTGSNPVYQQLYSVGLQVSWGVPVEQVYYRIVWDGPAPLNVRSLRTKVGVTSAQTGDRFEYEIRLRNTDVIKDNSEKPSWADASGYVFLSTVSAWQDVEHWAAPMYQQAISNSDSIAAVVADIRRQAPTSTGQIALALAYVQDNIRYLGLEMGTNSHQPTPASETLELRYGDCKDKTVLLISLLRGLGISAYPALVSTETGKDLHNYPPSHNLFDHVITYVENAGKSYWLDPTRRNQGQIIEGVYQPDYGHALVVGMQRNALTPMQPQHNSYLTIRDDFYLNADAAQPVTFTTSSDMQGWFAENFLSRLERSSMQELGESYQNYYQGYYSGTSASSPFSYERAGQHLITREQYSIADFWEEDGDRLEQTFYPGTIRNYLVLPEERERTSPFALIHPVTVSQTMTIHFEGDDWSFDNHAFAEQNAFFHYQRDVVYNKGERRLTLTQQYTSLTDHVPAADTADYIAAVERARAETNYGIFRYKETATTSSEEEFWPDAYTLTMTLLGICAAVLCIVLISWFVAMRREENTPQQYYPLPLWQFVFLMLITLGTYSLFWAYRNWKYIKTLDNSDIMPAFRSLFAVIWFFPLYNRVAKDYRAMGRNSLLASPLIAAAAALTYLLAMFSEQLLQELLNNRALPYTLLYILLPILPLAAVLLLINHQNGQVPSRLRWRHWLLATVMLPLLALICTQEMYLIPAGGVVEGHVISQSDRRFMDRRGVLPADDNLLYFYSDAFFDIRSDGNGFTGERVFSYWQDDSDDNFYFHSAKLADVKDIRVKYSERWDENTLVTIVTESDKEFVLYVSNDNKRDKLFVNSLKAQWKNQRQALSAQAL